MRGDTLVHQHPPTPPNTGAEYQAVLQHIVQYNTDRAYPFAEPSYDSSEPRAHEGVPSHTPHVDSHPRERLELGLQYDGYGPASEYYQNSQFNCVPNDQGLFSPPTPRSTIDDGSARRMTCSGRAVAPSGSPLKNAQSPRPKATPRVRKPKAGKGDKPKTHKLTAPLSILTKELHHIPVKNMEEWVNRLADVRRKEVEKRNGYITRPMNSFMLYRSAYAERAKSWCLQNNHQIVSSVAGESWPLEPPEIRELYNEYAKIERINHQNAHPAYKFSPSKTPVPPKKRKGEWSDEDDLSDLDDAEWAPGSGRSRSRQARRLDQSPNYLGNEMGGEYFDRFGPSGNGMNKSSWEMTNKGRPIPLPIGHSDMYNQYYQTAAYPAMHMSPAFADDMCMRRIGSPASSIQFQSNQSLIGLPGGNAGDLMQEMHPQAGTPFDERQLDPMLLGYDGSHHTDINPAALQHNGFQNGHSHMLDDKLEQNSLDSLSEIPHNEYHPGSWQPDPIMASLEHESEFDKWMGEHQPA